MLDIAAKAIERAKIRLGEKADNVNWIISDIIDFKPTEKYDCWHDRAAFHFLINKEEIKTYLTIAKNAINGFMVIGTFSDNGPNKCSMLEVHQYAEEELEQALNTAFVKLNCITEDHITPFETKQNFLFCSFRKK